MSQLSATTCLRDSGRDDVVDGTRWVGPVTGVDLEIVHRARGPVLDVGCGPGRHVLALAHDGKIALGIDLTPTALEVARSRGVSVLHRSVFARVPGAGRWKTALLIDGNVGIGGDPVSLIRRVAGLVVLDGEILVELDPPGVSRARGTVRLEIGSRAGPWFDWMPLSIDELMSVSDDAGTTVTEVWVSHGRWFAALAPRLGDRDAVS